MVLSSSEIVVLIRDLKNAAPKLEKLGQSLLEQATVESCADDARYAFHITNVVALIEAFNERLDAAQAVTKQ